MSVGFRPFLPLCGRPPDPAAVLWRGRMGISNGPGTPPFNQARAIGGLALLSLVIALALIDAVRTDFNIDSIQLGLLLGTALLLLGVEAGRKLLGP